MRAQLIHETATMAPGEAHLRLTGIARPVGDRVEIRLQLPDPTKPWSLDPRDPASPWGPTEYWFPLAPKSRTANELVLALDAAVTFHLGANKPHLLYLRDEAGLVGHTPLTGIAMRLPSSPPTGWTPHTEPAEQPPAPPAPDPVPEPPRPAPELAVDRREPPPPEPQPRPAETRGGRPVALVAAVVLLLALVAGGAWWWLNRPGPQSAEAPPAPPPAAAPARNLEAARKALAAEPTADAALALGKEHLAAKDLDGAFLLFRAGAEKGSTEAAVILGGFYDPATWTKETSPLPAANADQAANWYRRAAEAGDAEAQYRLGMVLKSGKTEGPDGPEQAVTWLRKAAEQGNAKAKEALGE